MNKLRKTLFILLFLFYLAGILIGAEREVHLPNQAEMYQYLEDGVKNYDTAVISGIKNAAEENLKLFLLLLAGSLFKPLIFVLGAAMLIKGYFSGFSVMAALRLYGIKGGLICMTNFISAAVLIPACAYYGSINAAGLIYGCEKAAHYKKVAFATIFLGAIFCADAVLKGAVSTIFVKWASKLINSG